MKKIFMFALKALLERKHFMKILGVDFVNVINSVACHYEEKDVKDSGCYFSKE